MAKRKRSSPIWEYFELTDVLKDGEMIKTASCTLCDDVQLAYTGGTTNLFNYLRFKHIDEYKTVTGEDSSSSHKRQTNIVSFNRCYYAAKVTNRIVQFIIRDMRPVSTVDGSGFQNLLGLLEPNYSIPSRTHISSVIRRMYLNVKEQLYKELESQYLALTTDLWTSNATEAYVPYSYSTLYR